MTFDRDTPKIGRREGSRFIGKAGCGTPVLAAGLSIAAGKGGQLSTDRITSRVGIAMLGMFKKKQPLDRVADDRTHEVLARAAAMLEMQLMLCKAEREKYSEYLRSKFVRGYLVGFFDAALQHASIDAADDERFMLLVSIGHTYLMEGDSETAGYFALDSLGLQGDPEFDRAQAQGGTEYFDFLEGKIRNPHGLMKRFHSDDLDQSEQNARGGANAPDAAPDIEEGTAEALVPVSKTEATIPSRIAFKLLGGRAVSAISFRVSETYSSLLEGRPTQVINDRIIEQKLKAAQVRELDKPHLIAPETVMDARHGLRLPALCCSAELMSSSIRGGMDGSYLAVVWFANPFFDEPLAAFVERSLRDISWDAVARDYEI